MFFPNILLSQSSDQLVLMSSVYEKMYRSCWRSLQTEVSLVVVGALDSKADLYSSQALPNWA